MKTQDANKKNKLQIRAMKFMPTCLHTDEPEVHKLIQAAVNSFMFIGDLEIAVGSIQSNTREVDLINIKVGLETLYIRVDYDKAEISIEYIEENDIKIINAFTQRVPFDKFDTFVTEGNIPKDTFTQILNAIEIAYKNHLTYIKNNPYIPIP